MPHFFRLKEQRRFRSEPAAPSDRLLARTDGSVERGPFDFHTDENGFIKTGVEARRDRQSFYFVGDSLVESSFAHPHQRFVSLVAQTCEWNVFNTGYSGTTLLQACMMIMGKLPAVANKGDVIVLFVPKSDSNAARTNGGYWTNNPTYTAIKPPLEAEPAWDFSFSDTQALLASIEVFLKGIGLKLVIVTSPHRPLDWNTDIWIRKSFGKEERFNAFKTLRAELDVAVRSASVDLSSPFLDLSALMGSNPSFFYDELHFNISGHEYAAAIITDFLRERVIDISEGELEHS